MLVELDLRLLLYCYRIFRCISRDFKTEKFAPKKDLDLYTDDNFKVSKIGADFLICCSNLQIIYPKSHIARNNKGTRHVWAKNSLY